MENFVNSGSTTIVIPEKRRAIIVLGMHRSGTSALTRVLNLAGATLPNNLLPEMAGNNERGFWEIKDFMEIHEELLASANSSWDDVSGISPFWFDSDIASSFQKRILKILEREFSEVPLFVIKDPRMCRLVPLWLRVLNRFDSEPLFVIPIRNPLEVAVSLKTRDNFIPAKSLLLWLRHFIEAEFHTREFKRVFVSYDAILKDWYAELVKIGEALDVKWPRLSHRATIEIEDFLSLSLRHHVTNFQEIVARPDIASWVKQTYEWGLNATHDRSISPKPLDIIRQSLEAADTAYGPLFAAKEFELTKSCDEASKLSEELGTVKQKLSASEDEMNMVRSNLKDREKELERLLQEFNALKGQIQDREEKTRALIEELNKSCDEATRLSEELGEVREQLAQRDSALADNRVTLEESEAAIRKLTEDLNGVRRHLEEKEAILQDLQVRLNQREAEVRKLSEEKEETLKDLQVKLNQHEAEVRRLSEEKEEILKDLQVKLNQREAEVRQLSEEKEAILQDLQVRLNQREAEVRQLSDEKETLFKQIEERDEIKSGLQELLLFRENERQQLSDEIKGLQSTSVIQQEQINQLNGEIGEKNKLINEKKQLLDEINSLQDISTTQQEQIKQLNGQIDERNKLIAERENAIRHLEKQREEEVKILQDQINNHREKIDSLEKEISGYRSDLEKRDALVQQLYLELDDYKKRLSDQDLKIEAYLEEIHQYKDQIVDQRIRNEEISEEVIRYKLKVEDRDIRFESLNEELDIRNKELEMRDIKIRFLSSDLNDYRRRLNEQENIAVQLSEKLESLHSRMSSAQSQFINLKKIFLTNRDSFWWKANIPFRWKLSRTIRRNVKAVEKTGLFDRDYYLAQNPDVADSGMDPIAHYVEHGAADGRNPNFLFDTLFYLKSYPDVVESGINPLLHFYEFGTFEGRAPHPLFDSSFYVEKNQDIDFETTNALVHYLESGYKENRSPHPLFDIRFYIENNPENNLDGKEPIQHYLDIGAEQGLNPHPLFDTNYYKSKHPSLDATGMNPLIHYLTSNDLGEHDPSPKFCTSEYLHRYSDVIPKEMNPLVHYVLFGADAGFDIGHSDSIGAQILEIRNSGLFDENFYLKEYPDVKTAGVDPVGHYCSAGWHEKRNPSPDFSTKFYLEHYSEILGGDTNPLFHYVRYGRKNGISSVVREYPKYNEELKRYSVRNLKDIKKSGTILFVGHDASRTGAPRLLLDLIQWFLAHTAFDIKILLLKDGPLTEDYFKMAPTMVLAGNVKYSKAVDELPVFCGKNLSLIYFNTVIPAKYLEIFCSLNAPSVCHVHELQSVIQSIVGPERMEDFKKYCQSYIAASQPVATNLVENHMVSEKQIDVIEEYITPIYPDAVPDDKQGIRRELGLEENSMIVFSCGTREWRKGPDIFVQVAARLWESGIRDVHFYWIGGTNKPAEDGSAELAQHPEIAHMVHFIGEKEDARTYFAAGDIFLLTSREDPFPLVCLEAAESGLPVLCFADAGGMPKFVEDDAGFVVPFADVEAISRKLEVLIENPTLRAKLGQKARAKILQRHTTDITALRIIQALRKRSYLTPFLSVIVPNYNKEKYLRQRLDSIFNQTFSDFEVILLDDASTDNSLEILEEYASRPGVTLITNKTNAGVFAQWEKGINLAKSDIIWIAEADDLCEPKFLETLLPAFNDPAVNLAYSQSYAIDKDGDVKFCYSEYSEEMSGSIWQRTYSVPARERVSGGGLGIKNNIPNASAVIFRKFDTKDWISRASKMKLCGDWLFYLYALNNGKIYYTPTHLNYHRRYDGTVISQYSNRPEIFEEYVECHHMADKFFHLDKTTLDRMRKFAKVIWNQIQVEGDFDTNYDNLWNALSGKIEDTEKSIIVTSYNCDRTGAPMIILYIARYLKATYGYRIRVLLAQDGNLRKEFEKVGQVDIVSFDRIAEDPEYYEQIQKRILAANPIFALCNGIDSSGFAHVLYQLSIKVTTLIHEFAVYYPQFIIERLEKQSSSFIFASNAVYQATKDMLGDKLQIPSVLLRQGLQQTEILYTHKASADSAIRNELGIDPDTFIVLGCGFFHFRKGPDIFIGIARALAAKRPDAKIACVWIGQPDGQPRDPEKLNFWLSHDIKQSGLEGMVHFIGEKEDVTDYFVGSDAFILTSRLDPFPNVILEAMAAGLPVLCFETGTGSAEIITDEVGFTVPYQDVDSMADRLLYLYDNPDLVIEYRTRNKRIIENDFDFAKYAEKVYSVAKNSLD